MKPDDPFREVIKEHYERTADAASAFRQVVDEWVKLWQVRLRLHLRLEWVRALRGGDLIEAKERLTTLMQRFEKAKADVSASVEELRLEARELNDQLQDVTAALPDLGQGPDFTPEQAAVLHLALSHEPIRHKSAVLPQPAEPPSTGVAGKSTLLFLPITSLGETRVIAAKFDELNRSEREWEQIERLRKLNLRSEIILPLACSQWGDGVILTQAAVTAHSGRCMTLLEYLKKCLGVARQNCRRCLDLAVEVLSDLYRLEPGRVPEQHIGAPPLWKECDVTQEVCIDWQTILEAACAWKKVDWSKSLEIPDPRSSAGRLPNPLIDAQKKAMTDTPVRHVHLSRIHGDLNLTNLLVQESRDRSPEKVYVIDLARSRGHQPTAFDFARLEAEICFRLFADDKFKGSVPKEGECDFLNCLDFIDGRSDSLPGNTKELFSAGAEVLIHLRHLAYKILKPHQGSDYVLSDYFRCLYFNYLWFLRFYKDLQKVRLALLGAASSLRTLIGDIEGARYSPGADVPFRRPWEQVTTRVGCTLSTGKEIPEGLR